MKQGFFLTLVCRPGQRLTIGLDYECKLLAMGIVVQSIECNLLNRIGFYT